MTRSCARCGAPDTTKRAVWCEVPICAACYAWLADHCHACDEPLTGDAFVFENSEGQFCESCWDDMAAEAEAKLRRLEDKIAGRPN